MKRKKNQVFRWKKSELKGNYFEFCSFTMVSKWRNGQYTGNESKMGNDRHKDREREREKICANTHMDSDSDCSPIVSLFKQ